MILFMIHVVQSLSFRVRTNCLSFVPFPVAIVLSLFLRYKAFDLIAFLVSSLKVIFIGEGN
jgi:hypothetical protein